jgi:hypothetical protein
MKNYILAIAVGAVAGLTFARLIILVLQGIFT